jgi:hypothetical protein
MKNRIIYLTTLLTAIWLSSCRLSTPAVYAPPEGKILELGTLKPIVGATVYLTDCDGEVLGNSNCITIDSTTSDAQGHYAFTKTGSRVQARKSGYFSDDTTEKPVLYESETMTDIVLPPHAWLLVKLINESGAYGFYPDQNGSGYPPIVLDQGRDTTLAIELRKGGANTKYQFTVRIDDINDLPEPPYWSTVKALVNDSPTNVNFGSGAILEFKLNGHDTTQLTINY